MLSLGRVLLWRRIPLYMVALQFDGNSKLNNTADYSQNHSEMLQAAKKSLKALNRVATRLTSPHIDLPRWSAAEL